MHLHSHGHGHAEHGHSHSHEHGAALSAGVLAGSLAVTVLLVILEFAGGILGHSISLVSDAVHNLSDIPSLAISWLGLKWANRPADDRRTYGYHRTSILAAFTNAILLILVAVYLFVESWERYRHPTEINTGTMIWVSLVALVINGGITLAVVRGRHDLNVRSVFIHNLGDALSNVAILIGALAIRSTGAAWVDPLLGAGIGVAVLWSSIGILRESTHILLEGLPREMELEGVAKEILAVPGVHEIHDVHIWTLGTDLHALSCHVRIPDMHMEESERVRSEIQKRLETRFHITHTTIQFERAGLPPDSGFYMPEPVKNSRE
jgi:cobalt-zinc-cadmium efflux system protein